MRENGGKGLLLGLLVTAVGFVVLYFWVADGLAGLAAQRFSGVPTLNQLHVLLQQ